MKKALAIAIALGAMMVAILVWRGQNAESQTHWPPVVFREVSQFPILDVQNCVLRGNDRGVFAGFERFHGSTSRGPVDTTNNLLIDSDRSRLFIGLSGFETVVSLRSEKMPTEQQLDLLRWCIGQPSNRWIPEHLRNK